MAEDYYPNSEPEVKPPSRDQESEEPDEQTFLVPKSALGNAADKQPGDRCEIEAVHVYDEEIEFKYVPHGEKKESELADVDRKMDSMAEENMASEEM